MAKAGWREGEDDFLRGCFRSRTTALIGLFLTRPLFLSSLELLHSLGQRSASYAAPSAGAVSFAKLDRDTDSRLLNHL